MFWTQELLVRLKEMNNLKKIPRYFAIKKLVEDIVKEETTSLKGEIEFLLTE